MRLNDVMDELAARIDGIDGLRVHAFPADNVAPPAAEVVYPESYEYDATYGRGSDRLTVPVIVTVGRASDRASAINLGAYADGSGPKSIKSAIEGATYLNLPTTAASATTPDHADFATNQLEVRILAAMDDWTSPGAFGMHLIGQEDTSPQTDKSFTLSVHPNGRPRLAVYPDGATVLEPSECDTATGFPDGSKRWLRCVFLGDFSGLHAFQYYTAADNGTLNPSFTTLGSGIVAAGTVTLHNSSQPLQINGPIFPNTGKVYYAEVRHSVTQTILTNPDFRRLVPGTTSFKDSTGKVWTLNGTAAVVRDPNATPDYESFDSARVTDVEFGYRDEAGVPYVMAKFNIDVFGEGN